MQLKSETLELHTIITYDEKEGKYFYFPFSERGYGKLPAEFIDGKLIVNANETTRYIFEASENNGFREHGEKLVDGEWTLYFDDIFKNLP